MKTIDSVGITFVNALLGRGIMNGVINLTLGAYTFTPEGEHVEPDLVVLGRLRMDPACARQLYEGLGALLVSIEKTAEEAAASTGLNGSGLVAGDKPN
jgi:hypothetical protein